jgi:signal transduction histidine kinase
LASIAQLWVFVFSLSYEIGGHGNMRVCVVSDYSDLSISFDECEHVTVVKSGPGESHPEADLYIWDCSAGIDIQAHVLEKQAAQHLVLVEPKDLDALDGIRTSVCILLKPVSPFTLRAFADIAVKASELRKQAYEADILRLDRDALLQYVLEANLKLQEYDQDRSNFLARALHDFRTPLTALHGYCGLLAQAKLGAVTAEQQELLARMLFSTRRLIRLAEATLELLGEGRFEKAPKRYPGDIKETIVQALHDVRPFVQDKAVEVSTHIEPPDGILSFAAEQIQQVVVNLIENSCKFAPKNGSITIHGYGVLRDSGKRAPAAGAYTSSADGYRVDIQDSGPGVPAHMTEKIFEQYVSCSGGSDRSGGGLGLAICKAIITAHGGTVWATPSEKGGRFSFVLPLEQQTEVTDEGPIDLRLGSQAAVWQ